MARLHLLLAVLRGPAVLVIALAASAGVSASETWRGLVVAPEDRCDSYSADDYHYPQSVELKIIEGLGDRIYGPYTGTYFIDRKQTDIEHIVARSEAHDSGLCGAGPELKAEFARDLLNLTLAAPHVNRCNAGGKCDSDAAEWLPDLNRCWFAARVIEVRQKYSLTIDREEAGSLDDVLRGCPSTEMVFAPPDDAPEAAAGDIDVDPLALWDDNGNGRITCKEARRHGIAPVGKGHPAYVHMHDRDGDGVVCE